MWHEAGLTGTHTCGKHMARATSCPILLFTLPLSFSPCFPVQLATFAYGGSCNFCRLLPLDAAHQNSLALATSTWSWKAVAAVRERASVLSGAQVLSSIPLTFASFIYRKSATEQHSNGKCHLPPTRSSGWNSSSSRSSRATCHSKSRRAALQQIVRLFPIEARAGTDAGCVAALLRRFSACFDFPSLPFLICHLKQKLPNLSLAWRGWFSHPSSLPRSSTAARRDVVCSLGCLGWLLVVWFVAFIKVA